MYLLQPENQPEVDQDELVEDEQLILYKNANFLVKRSDYNLDQLTRSADILLRPFGMQGTEAIGGRLYLTNYRLLFASHAFNRSLHYYRCQKYLYPFRKETHSIYVNSILRVHSVEYSLSHYRHPGGER